MIRPFRIVRRTPRHVWDLCYGRWFYLFGLIVWSAIELFIFLTTDRLGFIEATRTVQVWSIVLTLIYKVIVVAIMIGTRPKTTLDRTWIWHTASLGSLFAAAAFVSFWPGSVGLPKPGRPLPGQEIPGALVVYTFIVFQIWGYINWSALAVLRETWRERGRFVRVRWHRTLKTRRNDMMPLRKEQT